MKTKIVGVGSWDCTTLTDEATGPVRDILHFEGLEGTAFSGFKRGGVVPASAPAGEGEGSDGAYVHIRQIPAYGPYPERWVEWRGWWSLHEGVVSFRSTASYSSARRSGHWGGSIDLVEEAGEYRVLEPGKVGLRFESPTAKAHFLEVPSPGGGCAFRALQGNVPGRPELSVPVTPKVEEPPTDSAARRACLSKCDAADLTCNLKCTSVP